jgi:hypothetical protein
MDAITKVDLVRAQPLICQARALSSGARPEDLPLRPRLGQGTGRELDRRVKPGDDN